MSAFSRRQVLGAGAAVFGAAALGACDDIAPTTSASPPPADVPEETRSLDQLYADALREGGRLVVYAGGDTASQQDGTEQAFRTRFPGLNLTTVVGYSKFHDARVDNQIATGTLIPDVVALHTLHDFPS